MHNSSQMKCVQIHNDSNIQMRDDTICGAYNMYSEFRDKLYSETIPEKFVDVQASRDIIQLLALSRIRMMLGI